MKIGFIGQGWIGKNYADDFEKRGYDVIRFALEPKYEANKELIQTCDIVFIAVPTPTTVAGFSAAIVESVLSCVGIGKIAVIKSTLQPGTTKVLQNKFPAIFVFHSPEFLVEKSAAYDAAHPNRNIIGTPIESPEYTEKAGMILSVLPQAPYTKIMPSWNAEFVKYAGNCFLFTKVVFMNILYDFVAKSEGSWEEVREALIQDPRIGESHTSPVHSSGRGAGGHCFIKDFQAFKNLYQAQNIDAQGDAVLQTLIDKNIQLLLDSNKDLDLLEGVYGNMDKYRTHKNVA